LLKKKLIGFVLTSTPVREFWHKKVVKCNAMSNLNKVFYKTIFSNIDTTFATLSTTRRIKLGKNKKKMYFCSQRPKNESQT
jgi:hypothetical protein